MEFVSRQRVRFDDVDGAGIVYYPRFFHLCHKAFEDWFNDQGPIPYAQLIGEKKRGFPTVAVVSDFSHPLFYGDEAVVKISVEKIGSSSLKNRYEIFNQDQIKCFDAQITTVFVELGKNKALPISAELRSFFANYCPVA